MRRISIFFLLLSLLILVGCGAGDTNSGASENTSQTEVALTVRAVLTEENTSNDSGVAASNTPALPSPTPSPLPEDSVSKDDRAGFITDVTIPDYSGVDLNAKFTKTWRLSNIGDSTWTTDYKLIYESGEKMGAPDFVNLPKEVPPNSTVDISVEFTAPDTAGEYRSNWLLENAAGEKFGIGETALPVYVIIIARDPSSGGSSGSGGGIAGGATVTSATISIDNPSYSGSCPANLTLSGSITTSSAGSVLWSLNFSASTVGFTFDPSGTYSLTYGDGGGTQFWQYTLFISSSVKATAQLSVSGASGYTSSPIGFSVTCQ